MESLAEAQRKVISKIKSTKHWHHDIKYVDGRFVELVVKDFQETQSEDLLVKIIDNYAIFKGTWAKAFSQYLDGDIDAGVIMHDEIVWRAAFRFDRTKSHKPDGKAFNAYVVSALLNQLKNQRNSKMSHKNHPRVKCPVCNEEVYQIDHKHLKHSINMERYQKMFPKHPLVSTDGKTLCPITGVPVRAVNQHYLNRLAGRYTIEDFKAEFPDLAPKTPATCPVTGLEVKKIDAKYPSMIMEGYTEEAFLADFPNFEGAITCPFSGKKVLEITQGHLDKVVNAQPTEARTMAQLEVEFPNYTFVAQQVPVVNPYTGKKVNEINLAMISSSGSNWKEHMEKYAETWHGKYYPQMTICPFTGRKTHMIKKNDIEALGRTVSDFYRVVSKYPLKKHQVKCAICGDWVDNVWSHLEQKDHSYAPAMTINEFEGLYGAYATKIVVKTNSYVENDAGDSIHLADLFPDTTKKRIDFLEIEDSLLSVAQDDFDEKIAKSIRGSSTIEDIFYQAANIQDVVIPFAFESGMTKAARDAVKETIGVADFDLAKTPVEGSRKVSVMTPSRDTIRRKLSRMIESSDLAKAY